MAFYEYLHIKDCWFKTGIVPTIDTRIEVDNAGFHSYNTHSDVSASGGNIHPTLIGCNYSDWDRTKFVIKCSESPNVSWWGMGNSEHSGNPFVIDTFYNVAMDKDYYTVDGVQSAMGVTTMDSTNLDIWLGAVNYNGQMFRCGDIYAGNVRIYQGGVLVLEWIPTLYNGEYTYYDTVSGTYATKYGSGTVEPGPLATVFEPSQDTFTFSNSGGTQTFTVEADNAWTCTAPTDFTMSPLSGSAGETTVTITAPMRLTSKTNTVTFTDSDTNTFDITIAQSDQNITPNLTMYRGSTTIKKMYYGTDLVYRKMAHSPSLTVSPTSLSIDPNGGTQTFTVTTDGTFTATTADSWITLSTSGTTVTVTATATQSNRSGSITVTATNGFVTKTATVAVSQMVLSRATYVTTSYSSRTNTYIDTDIYPTTDTVMKIKYKPNSNIGGALVGYTFGPGAGTEQTPTYSVDDDTDFRYFFYNGLTTGYFDFNTSRISRSLTYDADGYITVECGNNYITNVNNSQTTTGTTQGSMATTTVPIYINICSNAWLQSVEIWQGATKVYDGYAANDGTNYGWYDSIGGTFTTQTYGGYAMTGAI